MRQLLIIFVTVFLAELGDKTQLAALLFATGKQHHPFLIFLAAASALVASTAAAVVLGNSIGRHLTQFPIKLIAGAGFIAIGAWTVFDHFKG